MYPVVRRGAIGELAGAGELAGVAADACVRADTPDPAPAEAFAAWRERPAAACVQDAGPTEVPPGTVTVIALDDAG